MTEPLGEEVHMLAYAANRPVAGQRQSSPHILLVVATVHVAAIAALMSAKMDLPQKIRHSPIIVDFVDPPIDPPPNPLPQPKPAPGSTRIDHPTHFLPTPPIPGPTLGQPDEGT